LAILLTVTFTGLDSCRVLPVWVSEVYMACAAWPTLQPETRIQ